MTQEYVIQRKGAHVVVEGYDKYSKEEMIHFVSRVVKASLSVFQSSQKPLA